MSYTVIFKATAEKQFAALSYGARKQVGAAVDLLTKDALPAGAKPLRKATDFCSIDAGEYRIVYSNPLRQIIYVMRIQHRDTVYKNLKRLQAPT